MVKFSTKKGLIRPNNFVISGTLSNLVSASMGQAVLDSPPGGKGSPILREQGHLFRVAYGAVTMLKTNQSTSIIVSF